MPPLWHGGKCLTQVGLSKERPPPLQKNVDRETLGETPLVEKRHDEGLSAKVTPHMGFLVEKAEKCETAPNGKDFAIGEFLPRSGQVGERFWKNCTQFANQLKSERAEKRMSGIDPNTEKTFGGMAGPKREIEAQPIFQGSCQGLAQEFWWHGPPGFSPPPSPLQGLFLGGHPPQTPTDFGKAQGFLSPSVPILQQKPMGKCGEAKPPPKEENKRPNGDLKRKRSCGAPQNFEPTEKHPGNGTLPGGVKRRYAGKCRAPPAARNSARPVPPRATPGGRGKRGRHPCGGPAMSPGPRHMVAEASVLTFVIQFLCRHMN